MAADITGDLPAAGGVAYQRGIRQIECVDHGGQIVGVAVHVVPR